MKIILISIIVILLSGCSKNVNPKIIQDNSPIDNTVSVSDNNTKMLEMQLENLKWFKIDNSCIQYAEDLTNGKLRVSSHSDCPNFNIDDIMNIDWNIQVENLPNEYQLNLQGLNPILFLCAAHNLGDNAMEHKYLDLAYQFLISWENYEKNKDLSESNIYVWDSHGMAMRTENLVYFALTGLKDNYFTDEQLEKINEVLAFHGEKLSDNKYYYSHHNHGVLQDRALIVLAYYFNNAQSKQWLELAKNRLQEQWNFSFTSEMVNTENSFDYQTFNKNLYSSVIQLLEDNGDEWGKEKKELLKQCDDVIGYMIKPNNTSSLHGESTSTVYSKASGSDNTVLQYVTSEGLLGNIPENNYVLYDQAGYYIYREYWPTSNADILQASSEDSVWLMFKSGFVSTVHKQDDDNSFQLYAKGHDIFVDPGFFGYVGNDLRMYLTSAAGHNAVSLDGKTYYAKKQEPGEAGIIFNEFGNGYGYVVGKNDYYSDVQLRRHFINLSETVFLYDECISENEHIYTQNFQCGPDITVESVKDDEILLLIDDTNYKVRIQQLNHNTASEVLMGAEDTPYGQYSPHSGEVEYINSIRFTATGTNVNFATLISIEDQDGNNIDFSSYIYDSEKNTLHFQKSDSNELFISLKPFAGETAP